MQKLNYIVVFILLFFTACSNKSYQVDGAGKADANMEDYHTYAFASQVDNKIDPGFFFLSDLMLKAQIRDAVKHEMDSRGYTYNPSSADLIVNFRVFDKPATIQGLQGLGDTYWSSAEATRIDNAEMVELKEGSIIIHLVDRKTGELIYQGYASGLMNGGMFNTEKNKIAESVSLIFDSYNHRADRL